MHTRQLEHCCIYRVRCTLRELSSNGVLSVLNFIRHATLYCTPIMIPVMQAESVDPWSYLQMLSVIHALRDLWLFPLSFVFLSLPHSLSSSLSLSLKAADLAAFVHKLRADLCLLSIRSTWALAVIHNIDRLNPSDFLARRNMREVGLYSAMFELMMAWDRIAKRMR